MSEARASHLEGVLVAVTPDIKKVLAAYSERNKYVVKEGDKSQTVKPKPSRAFVEKVVRANVRAEALLEALIDDFC